MAIGNFTNFAIGTLIGGLTAASDEIRLSPGDIASFRQDLPFQAVVWNTNFPAPEWAAKEGQVAVILVTAIDGDVMTFEEGSDTDFPIKDLNDFRSSYQIIAPIMADWANEATGGGGGGGASAATQPEVDAGTVTNKYVSPKTLADKPLPTVNADVGSFTNTNLTVDAFGRVTAAENGSAGGGGSGVYYVDSVGGSDANSGLAASAPKQTMAGLLALSPGGGATIYLKRFSVWREVLDLTGKHGASVLDYGAGDYPKLSSADLMNSSWTNTSGIVYQRTISIPLDGTHRLGVWDLDGANGGRLRVQTSVANCQANPGSCYYSGGVLYVSCFDSGAPVANQIEVAMRSEALNCASTDHIRVRGIQAEKSTSNNGSATFGLYVDLDDCRFWHGGAHNFLFGSGTLKNISVLYHGHISDYGGDSSFIAGFFDRAVTNAEIRFTNISVGHEWSDLQGSFFTAHAEGGGTYAKAELTNCRAEGLSTIYGNQIPESILRNNYFHKIRGVLDLYSGNRVLSINNTFHAGGDSSFIPFQFVSSANVASLSSVGDTFVGEPPYGSGMVNILGGAQGLSIEILQPSVRFEGPNQSHTFFASANSGLSAAGSVATLTAKGLRVMGCNADSNGQVFSIQNLTPGVISLALENNSYPSSAKFYYYGVNKNFSTWKAATSQEAFSMAIKSVRCGLVQAVTIPSMTAGQAPNLQYFTMTGLKNEDEITWGSNYQVEGLDVTVFANGNDSLCIQCTNLGTTTTSARSANFNVTAWLP